LFCADDNFPNSPDIALITRAATVFDLFNTLYRSFTSLLSGSKSHALISLEMDFVFWVTTSSRVFCTKESEMLRTPAAVDFSLIVLRLYVTRSQEFSALRRNSSAQPNRRFSQMGSEASLRGWGNTTGRAFWDGLDIGFIGKRLTKKAKD
jgi:hypothetical protein